MVYNCAIGHRDIDLYVLMYLNIVMENAHTINPVYQLRTTTCALHQRLHETPLLKNLLSHSLTVEDYIHCLTRFVACYQQLEPTLVSSTYHQQLPSHLVYKPRLIALHTELTRLGHEVLPTPANTKPDIAIETVGQYWGVRYVLDGSSQGAKALMPRIAKHLPDTRTRDLHFWQLLFNQAKYWPKMINQINYLCEIPHALDDLLETASRTFTLFVQQFEQP